MWHLSFSHLLVFIPNPEQWIEIHSAPEFISTIQKQGMRFDLTTATINRWRKEILSSSNASVNL